MNSLEEVINWYERVILPLSGHKEQRKLTNGKRKVNQSQPDLNDHENVAHLMIEVSSSSLL